MTGEISRTGLSVLVMAGAAFSGCTPVGRADSGPRAYTETTSETKVAIIGVKGGGPGEPNFEQKYDVSLNLPMEESQFIKLIEELGLKYFSSGPEELDLPHWEPGFEKPIVPKHTLNYDMSDISHSFIVSEPELDGSRQISYIALVRNDNMVVFVENMFSYL